jgi:hypothetical protein
MTSFIDSEEFQCNKNPLRNFRFSQRVLINKAFKIAQSSADVVQFQCKKYPEQAPYPEAQEELK